MSADAHNARAFDEAMATLREKRSLSDSVFAAGIDKRQPRHRPGAIAGGGNSPKRAPGWKGMALERLVDMAPS